MSFFVFLFILFGSLANAEDLSLQTLWSGGLHSAREAIDRVPIGLRCRSALLHASKSAHRASVQNPRMMFFPEVSLKQEIVPIIAISTSEKSSPVFEALEFNSKTRRVRFYEGIFQNNSLQTGEVSKCLSCHNEGKLLWRGFNEIFLWPGTFGNAFSLSGRDSEQKLFHQFLATTNATTFSEFNKSDMEMLAQNSEFERLLGAINTAVQFPTLKKHPLYKKMQTAIIAALLGDVDLIALEGWDPVSEVVVLLPNQPTNDEIKNLKLEIEAGQNKFLSNMFSAYFDTLDLPLQLPEDISKWRQSIQRKNKMLLALALVFKQMNYPEAIELFLLKRTTCTYQTSPGFASDLLALILEDMLSQHFDTILEVWDYFPKANLGLPQAKLRTTDKNTIREFLKALTNFRPESR